jgi:hypothetical protein
MIYRKLIRCRCTLRAVIMNPGVRTSGMMEYQHGREECSATHVPNYGSLGGVRTVGNTGLLFIDGIGVTKP